MAWHYGGHFGHYKLLHTTCVQAIITHRIPPNLVLHWQYEISHHAITLVGDGVRQHRFNQSKHEKTKKQKWNKSNQTNSQSLQAAPPASMNCPLSYPKTYVPVYTPQWDAGIETRILALKCPVLQIPYYR